MVELALDHAHTNEISAYDRVEHFTQRVEPFFGGHRSLARTDRFHNPREWIGNVRQNVRNLLTK